MKSLYKRLVAVVLALVSLFCIGGVSAAWVYADGPISPTSINLGVDLFTWVAGEDQGDQTTDEKALAGEIVNILNGMNDKTVTVTVNGSPQQMTGQDAFEQLMENRQNQGSSYYPMNELAVDDPNSQALKELLGIEDDTEISAVIKIVDATSTKPGYELYTTRVDVNAKVNDEFVIPKADITNENHYIYPVNKITFVKDTSGDYIQNDIVAGYSRAIFYYQNNSTQYDGEGGRQEIRSFDVTLWNSGDSYANAVQIENGILNGPIYVDYLDQESTWFYFGASRGNGKTITCNTEGVELKVWSNETTTVGSWNESTNTYTFDSSASWFSRATYRLQLIYHEGVDPGTIEFQIND